MFSWFSKLITSAKQPSSRENVRENLPRVDRQRIETGHRERREVFSDGFERHSTTHVPSARGKDLSVEDANARLLTTSLKEWHERDEIFACISRLDREGRTTRIPIEGLQRAVSEPWFAYEAALALVETQEYEATASAISVLDQLSGSDRRGLIERVCRIIRRSDDKQYAGLLLGLIEKTWMNPDDVQWLRRSETRPVRRSESRPPRGRFILRGSDRTTVKLTPSRSS